jgi:hypothetical protein
MGFLMVPLKSSLRKIYDRLHDLVNGYGISMSQMTTDTSFNTATCTTRGAGIAYLSRFLVGFVFIDLLFNVQCLVHHCYHFSFDLNIVYMSITSAQ